MLFERIRNLLRFKAAAIMTTHKVVLYIYALRKEFLESKTKYTVLMHKRFAVTVFVSRSRNKLLNRGLRPQQ
jgi:hypothetical protein